MPKWEAHCKYLLTKNDRKFVNEHGRNSVINVIVSPFRITLNVFKEAYNSSRMENHQAMAKLLPNY